MADNYVITARIEVKDASTRPLRHIKKGFVSTEKTVARTSRRIRKEMAGNGRAAKKQQSAFSKSFAGMRRDMRNLGRDYMLTSTLIAVPLAGAAAGVAKIHSGLEASQIGIATIFNALTDTTIGDSMGAAGVAIRDLNRDAAKGAGDLESYTKSFSAIASQSLGLGKSIDEIRELNSLSINAGFALAGLRGMENFPLDIVQGLQGRVTQKDTPFLIAALAAIGMTPKEFTSLNQEEKFDAALKALRSYEEGVKLLENSWESMIETVKDSFKNIIREGTFDSFDHFKGQLQDFRDYLDENGDDLAGKLNVFTQQIADNKGVFASSSALAAGAVVARFTAPTMATAMKGAHAAKKGGLGVSGMLGGAAGLSGGAGVSASIGALLVPLGWLAAAAVSLVVSFESMRAALANMPAVQGMMKHTLATLAENFLEFNMAFESLTGGESVFQVLGAGLWLLVAGVGHAVAGFMKVVTFITLVVASISQVLGAVTKLGKFLSFDLKGRMKHRLLPESDLSHALQTDVRRKGFEGARDEKIAIANSVNQGFSDLGDRWDDFFGGSKDRTPNERDQKGGILGSAKAVTKNETKIDNVNINIKAELTEDPTRIARSMKEILYKVAREGTKSRAAPLSESI